MPSPAGSRPRFSAWRRVGSVWESWLQEPLWRVGNWLLLRAEYGRVLPPHYHGCSRRKCVRLGVSRIATWASVCLVATGRRQWHAAVATHFDRSGAAARERWIVRAQRSRWLSVTTVAMGAPLLLILTVGHAHGLGDFGPAIDLAVSAIRNVAYLAAADARSSGPCALEPPPRYAGHPWMASLAAVAGVLFGVVWLVQSTDEAAANGLFLAVTIVAPSVLIPRSSERRLILIAVVASFGMGSNAVLSTELQLWFLLGSRWSLRCATG